jgi:hypothetical protein
VRLIVGCRLDLVDGMSILVYPIDLPVVVAWQKARRQGAVPARLPAQIVRDARDHSVEVRPVCVNASRWDCTLEPTDEEDRFAVRLGLRMVHGLANAAAAAPRRRAGR